MKLNFSRSIGCLRGKSWACLLGLLLSVFAAKATQSLYLNTGTIFGIPPNVDATNFYNSGTWNIYVNPNPYQTTHTLNYTNAGTMTSLVGWEFDYGTSTSMRTWSTSFFNQNPATIEADDGYVFDPPTSPLSSNLVSYLLVSATNLINKGTLIAGANGEIILNGGNVDLSHSQLGITPINPTGSSNNGTNGYNPDAGIYDEYWGTTNNLVVDEFLWDGSEVEGYMFKNLGIPCGMFGTNTIGPLVPTASDSISTNTGLLTVTYTNQDTTIHSDVYLATNQFRQAVFVFVPDDAISAQIMFSPAVNSSNLFETTAVQLSTAFTNVMNRQLQASSVYLVDTFGPNPQFLLLADQKGNPTAPCTATTFRPANYTVSRSEPVAFTDGSPGLGMPAADFFYESNPPTYWFSNAVVSGAGWAAYSAFVTNNLGAGRVRVYANNLNLNQAKMRGESQILVQATNLSSSLNANLDCQNLSFNLGATNGSLNFTNLAVPLVGRLHGTINMWSGFWTNYEIWITPSFATNSDGVFAEADITNVLQINLCVFVVDASGLTNTIPVTVQDLDLHSTNITIGDNVNVSQTLLLDGSSLTLAAGGGISLSYPLQDWTCANAPTLRYFTNNGTLSIPNNAHFGDDTTTNYAVFVNNGSIISAGQTIDSDNLQINNGTNTSFLGGFSATAQTSQLTSATIQSASDIQFFANDLQISQSILYAGRFPTSMYASGGALDFTVTGNLSDGGTNSFYCQNGFNLWTPPATGELLNTTITDEAVGQALVDHYWAGLDYGTNFANHAERVSNAPIATLVFYPTDQPQMDGYYPLFWFHGLPGGSVTNGLYVNYLDLSKLTDYASEIDIDPNLTIYFVTSSIAGFTGHQFPSGGKMVQLPASVSLLVTPETPKSIASTEFELSANYSAADGGLQLTSYILPMQTNVIEASTDLVHWLPIYTNIGSYTNLGESTITDPKASNYSRRFYRATAWP